MNSISGVQWRHTNQYSLPLRLSLLHLKLQPRGRQMAQHISWSQGHSTSLLISKSILRTFTLVWTVPDILEIRILVSASRPSSSPTSNYLLAILATNYCPKEFVNNFVLKRMFNSRQELKNTCHSSVCTDYKWMLQHRASMQKDTSILLNTI